MGRRTEGSAWPGKLHDRATVETADANWGDNRSSGRFDEGNPSPADVHPLRAPDRFHLAPAIAHLEQFVSLRSATRSIMRQVGGGTLGEVRCDARGRAHGTATPVPPAHREHPTSQFFLSNPARDRSPARSRRRRMRPLRSSPAAWLPASPMRHAAKCSARRRPGAARTYRSTAPSSVSRRRRRIPHVRRSVFSAMSARYSRYAMIW